jgi:hypothetical protein
LRNQELFFVTTLSNQLSLQAHSFVVPENLLELIRSKEKDSFKLIWNLTLRSKL